MPTWSRPTTRCSPRRPTNWLVREIVLYWKRTLKRLDVSSRSLIALVEPGSCFAGTLFELVLASDRSYMLDGVFEGSNLPAATVRLTAMNFGPYPMGNGLTRLASRFLAEPKHVDELKDEIGEAIDAEAADELGLVTFTPDDIDWEDEVRLVLEERAGFSPDGLIGMEANLRFAGPETMETKIFARLSAWQNWIFQRPNATGPEGALKLYGTGKQSQVRPQAGCKGGESWPSTTPSSSPTTSTSHSDRRLQRALENWQPRFLDWWKDMGPDGTLELRRLSAHRHLGRCQRLGQFRLREDAGLSLGHLSRRPGSQPRDRLRRQQGQAGLAGGAGRAALDPAPPDRDPGRHRARLGRAAAPSGQDRAFALRPAQPLPDQLRGRPASVGHGLPAARLFRPRRPRGGGDAAGAPFGRSRQAAHPGRLQRADAGLAVLLHVHLSSPTATASTSSPRSPNRASIRWRAPAASC